MRSFKLAAQAVFVMGSLLLTSSPAMATYVDQDGTRRDVLYNYQQNKVRYVMTYQEEGSATPDGAPIWKFQVLDSVNDSLEKIVYQKEYKFDRAAADKHSAYVAELKKMGFIDPNETETVLDDNAAADLGVLTSDFGNSASAKEGNNPIWRATNQWSWEWEVAFANWISTSVDRFFFTKYRIPTDCADVIISLRWIFARMNSLPIANTLSSSGKMVGHMSEDPSWSNLPTAQNWYEDQRFMTALAYVKDVTYTKSLKNDSYPIAVKKGVLIPGVHHLEFHSAGGHAMIVSEVKTSSSSSTVMLMDSTLPVQIRKLGHKKYIYGNQPDYGTGFLRVLWPYKDGDTWRFVDAEDHPGFSEEQYLPEFMGVQTLFAAAVEGHLSGKANGGAFSHKNFEESIKALRFKYMERVLAVNDGLQNCPAIDCAPGTAGWAEYSTPSRDGKLKDLVMSILRTVEAMQHDRNVMRVWNKFVSEQLDLKLNRLKIPMADALTHVRDDKISSDPRVSLEARWGY